MVRWLVVLAVLGASASAWAQDEDDPAFSRQAPASQPAAVDDYGPTPNPEDEDPGLAPVAPPPLVKKMPRFRADPYADFGIGFRVSYKTVLIPEAAAAPVEGFPQEFKEDRFHGVAVDVYPISWYARLGLSTQ